MSAGVYITLIPHQHSELYKVFKLVLNNISYKKCDQTKVSEELEILKAK